MKYLKKFNTESEYNSFKESDAFIKPNVSSVIASEKVFYSIAEPVYITFRYYAPEVNSGWGNSMGGDYTEIKVIPGTTFEQLISIKDSETGFYVWEPPYSCDDAWGINVNGEVCSAYAPGCLSTYTDVYVLKNGVRVKGTDVIEDIEYTLEMP